MSSFPVRGAPIWNVPALVGPQVVGFAWRMIAGNAEARLAGKSEAHDTYERGWAPKRVNEPRRSLTKAALELS